MKIIALCKTFSCNEFIEAAIESLYGFVDNFVFVNSNISWTGNKKANEVKPVIDNWQKNNDKQNKIIHIEANVGNQWLQYNIGYKYIRSNLNADWILIFDTDEIWDYNNLKLAKQILRTSVQYNSISAKMHTYLKSPFYRVAPPEYCIPTVFFRPIHYNFLGTRGNRVGPRFVAENLFFHHFTYVRRNEKNVFKKIDTTLAGDRDDNPKCQLVDLKNWKENKWDKLPRSRNLHTTKMFESSWYKVRKIGIRDLPETLRNKPIVKQFM